MAAARVGIVLLVVMVIAAQLVATPEPRLIQHPAVALAHAAANGKPAGVPPSKWNMPRTLGAVKRTVPGGPDPQHHY
ncbi:hypothetical protein CFC21_003427 [Triticum aestivum]|uniref:Uncharacterized protein n=3 Tax=Triticum TaxID=4564 RepID=A0A9R0QG05_TRITD|nr:hypothetical protein TRIUR3_07585 [Triticum urartu]KAF6985587.1 hypothetical protein CFC21_003427 [Triticum aestivum]VAH09271.1 unnamed protein product [Triticum turgidum subsp. durum]